MESNPDILQKINEVLKDKPKEDSETQIELKQNNFLFATKQLVE